MKIQYENLTIRQAEVADAEQLAAWWNDGAVMAHAGFQTVWEQLRRKS